MAKEVERRIVATVQPYQGSDPGELLPHVPNSDVYDRKDWTELRPPANTRVQEAWSKIATPYRAFLLFQLWLTYAWWRPAIFLLTLGTIATLLWIIITG